MSQAGKTERFSFVRLFAVFVCAETVFGAAAWVLLDGADLDDPETPFLFLVAAGLLLAALAAWLAEVLSCRTETGSAGERRAVGARSGPQPTAKIEDETLFGAMTAHELRTPLSVILAQTQQALLRERDPSEYRSALERSRQAALKIEKLLEGLQRLARTAHGSKASQPGVEELDALCARVFASLAQDASDRKIALLSEIPREGLAVDPELFELVLRNLVANAIQNGNAGGHVWVAASRGGGELLMTVRDDGNGIPESEKDLLFEPQGPRQRKDAVPSRGLGLGLAIVRRTLSARGGSIVYRNEKPHGAAFEVRLPISA